MQTLLLTLIGPARRIDLKLPAEVPIGELLPKMLELCGPPQGLQMTPAQWRLVLPAKNAALPATHSLLACGVIDGMTLVLQSYTAFTEQQQQLQRSIFRPQALPPGANTGGIGVKWNTPER